MLKGIDIILYEKTKTGEDGFHDPIYEESPVTVQVFSSSLRKQSSTRSFKISSDLIMNGSPFPARRAAAFRDRRVHRPT